MDLYRYFLVSSYSLLTISFVMLISTERLNPVLILLFAGVLVMGWLIDTARVGWAISKSWANGLMIGCLLTALAAWRFFGLAPIETVIDLTLFASSMKLLRWKSGRDWLWLYLVSFCLTLMTAGMMVDATFLLLVVLYLAAALSTLVSYEIRHTQMHFAAAQAARAPGVEASLEAEFYRETPTVRRRVAAPGGRHLLLTSFLTLAMIVLLATPLFLVMPRMARGGARNGLLSSETLVGFSDSVRLGEVAQVKQNPQIVMRVRVKYPLSQPPRSLRWRGVTLDYYDGQSWSLEAGRESSQRIRRIGDSYSVDEKLWTRASTEQRFFLEPLNINVIFAAPRPVVVTGLRELSRDAGDGLWTEDHSYFKLEYAVYSDTVVPSDEELIADNSRDYSREVSQRYLQLPRDHDARITELAADVTRGAASQLEIARRIERHLRESYGYTLDLKRVEDGDPVADFLFNVKEGHCEYFASAMVLMLRARRVPARLVNGFQTGEYNRSADIYTVRQSDAHSWVEVYFPKSGWVTFDPTPAAGLSNYDPDGWAAWFRRYSETMEMFWLEQIIGYDTGKQLSIVQNARGWFASLEIDSSLTWLQWSADLSRRIDRWREGSRERGAGEGRVPSAPQGGSTVSRALLVGSLSLAGLIGLVLFWRRSRAGWRRRFRQDASGSAIAFYQEMLQLLARAGHRRAPHQTPAEFAAQLALPAVIEITNLYQQTRFGEQPLSEEEIERVGHLLRELKGELAHLKRAIKS
ncbi:MAG: DUF3488 and transglutaminase-like domain-containing protein [Blastocatellia bacterium]|nr:DUF3488 and transglutaminase-like domain-containing protein [Blastocatellia bacterium]